MGRPKNNVVNSTDTNKEPILDPIAEGIVVDEFGKDDKQSDKEGE
jgi:hypothetical protein